MSRPAALRPPLRALWILALLATTAAAADGAADEAADEGGATGAGNAASRGWQCTLCPAPAGWNGELDTGGGWVSDSSLKFGDYRGLEDDGGFAALDGESHYRAEDGSFLDLMMRDLGIDNRSVNLRGGERGRYAVELAYREIPKYRGFGAETVYLGAGGNELTLPADWQSAANTSGMSGLAASLRPAELEIARKTVDASLQWRLGPRWSWDLEVQHQRKEGTRPFGAGVFTIHSSHFPAPVDFSTDRLEMGLAFAGEAAHWRLGFKGSEFDNAFPSVTWSNPFAAIPGTELLRASLEPDNTFYQFELAGAWAPVQRLNLSGTAAFGRMEQDDPLLPPSINPAFSDVPLPRAAADTRIDAGTLNLAGNLDARLSPRLTLTARLRHDERDNQTPVDLFTPIITDIAPRAPRPNRPYSFERDRASLALRYRARGAVRLQAGADFEDFERSLQSVLETEEQGYWGEIGLNPGSRIELRLRAEQSDRDAGPYTQVEGAALVEHPLMRKFHLADRERDRLLVDLDFFPLPGLTLSASYQQSKDDYTQSFVGLHGSEEQVVSLDAGWSLSERLYVHAFLSRDDIDSSLSGVESAVAVPWLAVTEDRFLAAGLGLQARVSRRVSLELDLVNSQSEGDIRVETGARGSPFPTLETDLWNARLGVDFRVTEQWGVKLQFEHEEYDSSDWALEGLAPGGLGPDGIAAILSFGAESPDYGVSVLRLQASYRF
jgi:MtrB/PioB family decaheme-associated outer membrane protein